jgi:hypothetical protein
MLRVKRQDGDDNTEAHQVDEDGEKKDEERRALARHANV